MWPVNGVLGIVQTALAATLAPELREENPDTSGLREELTVLTQELGDAEAFPSSGPEVLALDEGDLPVTQGDLDTLVPSPDRDFVSTESMEKSLGLTKETIGSLARLVVRAHGESLCARAKVLAFRTWEAIGLSEVQKNFLWIRFRVDALNLYSSIKIFGYQTLLLLESGSTLPDRRACGQGIHDSLLLENASRPPQGLAATLHDLILFEDDY
jgi:hypothetical protein